MCARVTARTFALDLRTEKKCIQNAMATTIHMIGLPHTIVGVAFSHCAFTGKILRFGKMMKMCNWRVLEYSNEGSESEAEHIQILSQEELKQLSKRSDDTHFVDADLDNSVLVEAFYKRVGEKLAVHTQEHDIVCHVFGPVQGMQSYSRGCFHVESGIGYTCHVDTMPYRIFESNTWRAWHAGRQQNIMGSNIQWVIPNYYDLDDWDFYPEADTKKPYVLFFGRIKWDKGLRTIEAIAHELPDTQFVICGQGDPLPWLRANIKYKLPIKGQERAELLGKATVVLCPSEYIEPFCGVNVESQLCGTPVISTDCGAFTETIVHGETGYICHMLADYFKAIAMAPSLDRRHISERARSLYSLQTVGQKYDSAFRQIHDMRNKGWYSEESHMLT